MQNDVRKQKAYQVVGNFALAVTTLLACACVHCDFKIVFQARAKYGRRLPAEVHSSATSK